MATITKRKNGWSVQVRRKGYAPRSQTFPSKTTALAWAREQEGLIDQGRLPVSTALLKSTSLHSLLDRYRMTITPKKLSAETEDLRLRRLQLDAQAPHGLNQSAMSQTHRTLVLGPTRKTPIRCGSRWCTGQHSFQISSLDKGNRLPIREFDRSRR